MAIDAAEQPAPSRAPVLPIKIKRRHRNDIMQLQRDGLPTTSAEALLNRMLNKIDDLRDERESRKRFASRPIAVSVGRPL